MYDLQVVKPMLLAKVKFVDYLSADELRARFLLVPGNPYPVVLRVVGENFDRAQEVLVNNVSCQYSIESPTQLIVTVPTSIVEQNIRSLFVVTDAESFTNSSVYSYSLSGRLALVRGPEKLMGQYIFLLRKTTTSGVFSRGIGGNLRKLVGSIFKTNDQAITTVAQMLLTVGEQIKDSQRDAPIPADEKLGAVDIQKIGYTKGDLSAINASVRLTTLSRASVFSNLQLGAQSLVSQLITE